MRRSPSFIALAETLERARGTRSKTEKVKILSAYLSSLQPDEAQIAARLAVGSSSERGSKDEAQVGYSTLLDVIREATGASRDRVSEVYLRHGDLGEVAAELLEEKKEQTLFQEALTLADIESAFLRLRSSKGKGSTANRKGVVKSLILRAAPLEGKYIVKVLTGEMRTGLVSGLLEEAIAAAYSAPKEDVARAHMIVGDIGLLAKAAAERRLTRLRITPFRPVNFMLAEPLATASEIADHFGKEVYAEYKYDGVRAQAHKQGTEVRLYSRRLEDITASFPEVAEALATGRGECILDGEIVPFEDGRPLPFQLLQRRLRRIENFDEAAKRAPVVYFVFDILEKDGREMVGLPLSQRKKEMMGAVGGEKVRPAEAERVSEASQIQAAFAKSRALGYEGLVVKDPEGVYTMGKRGSGWVKLKEELDTIDAVVVSAEYGHGKRAGVISDYTFAVRDGSSLKTIGKAYSGLTDEEIEQMTRTLKEITTEDLGYWRRVRPEVVIEVAFDSVQKSERHDSGYALRFPRIKRIRTDKSPSDIDTLQKVEKIFRGQKLKVEET